MRASLVRPPVAARLAPARRSASTAILGIILTLAGCESTPPPAPIEAPPAEVVTEIPLERADAALTSAEQARRHLETLTRLYEGGEFGQATEVIRQIAPHMDQLDDAERFRADEIEMELALLERDGLTPDDHARAARLLSDMQPVTTRQMLAKARFRARLLARHADNDRATALAWIAVAEHPAARERDVEAASVETWQSLSNLTRFEADNLARQAPTAVGRAWAALGRDYNGALTDVLQYQVWEDWRGAHAEHPGARFPAPGLTRKPSKRRDLALLLPLSGPLSGAGQAVRDGFSAALLHAEAKTHAAATSPATTVRLYDTGTMPAADAYRLAVSEGAELVVGPLRKSAVADVAALASTVPVLALNQLDDAGEAPQARIPQLALAPEDDASAIAAALAADAVERIVLFDNNEPWSARAKARFLAERGAVEAVATGRLTAISDLTRVVGDALAVAASTQRHREIAGILGIELQFTPRRRDDVDAVVALVSQRQLLSLIPALEFHFADALVVYAPSAAVGGALRPLDGVRVCGMPWQLHPDPLRTATAGLAASRGSTAPWFAFGIDGFRLANQWQRLLARDKPILGSTGTLRLGADGRISRQLAWAAVQRGRLVPRVLGRQ